jgi:hypothetical protein
MEIAKLRKKRGLSSENARIIRQRGHNDALEFAMAIGLTRDYKNDLKAKKDVIDRSGDGHSVKSGEKKWQIFLYGLTRFEEDVGFIINGIRDFLIECIKAFPSTFQQYQQDKNCAKQRLRIPMVNLATKLQDHMLLKAFLDKSIFNSGEVDYLTVKHKDLFHVFYYKDVLDVMCGELEVCNSRAISSGQVPEQKVLLRYEGINLGELEMRNDSPDHYRQVRFNMIIPKVMSLLFEKIPITKKYSKRVWVYGNAGKRFGRWRQKT